MLTEKEIQLLLSAIECKSTAEIAALYSETQDEIKSKLDSIYKKLNAHNKIQAALAFFNNKY